MTFSPLGDSALVIALGSGLDPTALPRVRALAAALGRDPIAGVVDVVPAFATVTVFYEIAHIGSYAQLCSQLEGRAARADAALLSVDTRTVEIPVCYGGDFGPDLSEVAARASLTVAEVIALHSGADYLAHAIGFAPGFAYLGGLPEKIHTSRRNTPRPSVPAGSVGIGGEQTGVYPLATPGGWNLIGRTPLKLFDPASATPALLRAADRVKFRAITVEEFTAWK